MRGIVFGCFAESVPKSSFRDLGTKTEPKRAKREPKGSKREAKGAKREPKGAKGSQKGAKGSQKAAKGCQKGAKGEPTGDQNASKSRPSEKVAKITEKGCLHLKGLAPFWEPFSVKFR